MNSPEDFGAWALSPDRTIEEAYFAERAVDECLAIWDRDHKIYKALDWESLRERARARKLNPAHRVRIPEQSLKKALEVLSSVKRLNFECHDDRPVRDISGLKFFPQLEELHFGWTEISDLSPVSQLKQLRVLWITDHEVEDLRPMTACTEMRTVYLRIGQPWPTITGFDNLVQLENFNWYGNLIVLEEISALPSVRLAKLETCYGASLPLRDCRRLPEMPALEILELENVHRLDGIERWSRLRNLTVGGLFRDLTPLINAKGVTHLTIKGNLTRDLSPLVRLPELRHLKVCGDHPQDYSVLSDAPKLHGVDADGCDINKLELNTLQAILTPWEEEFKLEKPRPLAPLRMLVRKHEDIPKGARVQGLKVWDGDPAMAASEARWFAEVLSKRISRGIKNRKWGEVDSFAAGGAHMRVLSLEAAELLPDIVRLTREVMATTRYPWQIFFSVDLNGEWLHDETRKDIEDAVELQRHIQDEIDSHLEYLRRSKEHKEFLERQHRLRLIEQDGGKVEPEKFAAPESKPIEMPENKEEDVDAGSVLETQRRSEVFEEEEREHPLAEALYTSGVITEDTVYLIERFSAAGIHLMNRAPDKE